MNIQKADIATDRKPLNLMIQQLNVNAVFYAPKFEEVEGHIGLGLTVRLSFRPFIRPFVRNTLFTQEL